MWNAETGDELESFKGEGHTQSIMDCRFSADGKQIFTASQDGTLKRWNVATRTHEMTYEGHDEAVRTLAISSDNTRLVSGSQNGSLIVWNVENGEVVALIKEHLSEVWGLAIFPGNARVISASWDTTLKVWSISSAEQIGKGWQHTPVEEADARVERLWGYMIFCACSPDGRFYAAGSSDGSLRVWNTVTGAALGTFTVYSDYTFAGAFSPDSRWLISGCWNGDVTLFDLTEERRTPAPRHSDMVLACGFIAEGKRIWSCSTDGIRVSDISGAEIVERWFWRHEDKNPITCTAGSDGAWFLVGFDSAELAILDTESGLIAVDLGLHPHLACSAVSADGGLAATGSENGIVKVWDLATRLEKFEFQAHEPKVVSCNFSPDCRRLVTASWDQTVRIWDLAKPETPIILRGHTDQCQDVCFSADGKRLLSTAVDGTVRLWDSFNGSYLGSMLWPADSGSTCTLSTDGCYAASASHRHALKLWNGIDGKLEHILAGHTNAVRAGEFSSNGQLISASADGTLILWKLESGEPSLTFTGHTGQVQSCKFLPDASQMASAGWDKTVRIWDTNTGRQLSVWEGHDGWIQSLLVIGNGAYIASCSHDGTMKIWEVKTGQCLRTLKGTGSILTAAATSSDGSRLVVGGEDGVLNVWNWSSGEHVATLNGHVAGIRHCAYAEQIVSASADGTFQRARIFRES